MLEIRPGVNTWFGDRNIVRLELGGIDVAYMGIYDGVRGGEYMGIIYMVRDGK